MPSYVVLSGDTFESVARKKYGSGSKATLIASGNPGLLEPLTTGTVINVPRDPNAPKNRTSQSVTGEGDDVSLLMEGDLFRGWTEIRITRQLDGMDEIEFAAPFDPLDSEFRSTFVPFSFSEMVVFAGQDQVFEGTMIVINPETTSTARTISVSGYSVPGVLNDCTPPSSAFPLEFDGLGISDIAGSLCAPFGIPVIIEGEQGAVFERVASNPQSSVLSFLADLAKQRNLIISSTPEGALLLTQSVTVGSPVASLKEGESPLLKITPAFNPQDYFSHISGMEPVFVGLKGSQFTAKNERLQGILRPHTFLVPDTVDADVKTAVDAKTGRMFGNMVTYSVEVESWRGPSGRLWAPNTTIKVEAPGAMVYRSYEFLIKTVEFVKDSRSQGATLTLTLPGAFSGAIPETLPWD